MIDLDNTDLSCVAAHLVTGLGTLVLGFRPDKAPAHVRNFLKLADSGFYDGVAFHRVIKNFMVQGGCPNSKAGASGVPGSGGPGWRVHAEFNDLPHERGALSAARAQDPNSAGSQFFVVHADHAAFLDRQYTVFGKLVDGLDVLDALANVDCEFGPDGERSTPKQRVEIRSIRLEVRDTPVLDTAAVAETDDARTPVDTRAEVEATADDEPAHELDEFDGDATESEAALEATESEDA